MFTSHKPGFSQTARGFTLIELTMAMGIMLVISSISVTSITTVVSHSRLRAGVSSMSGLLQNSRMLAVTGNRTLTTHFVTEPGSSLEGYVKEAQDTAPRSSKDPQVRWEAPVTMMATPVGAGAPAVLSSAVLGFTPPTGEPTFNTRGLPCAYVSGLCPARGFLYYFKDTSQAGAKGWAALSISPAGRIKTWFWIGANWTD